MVRRDELLGFIDKTRQLQRKMAYGFGAAGLISFALLFWSGTVGGFGLVIVALVAIAAFWITAAHNAANRQKIAELDRIADNGGKPLQTAHRRWTKREK